MVDTMEENTEWVRVWAVNSLEHLPALQDAARKGADALQTCVREIWTTAPEDSETWYQGRDMSDADYDNTDWASLVDDVLDVRL